MTLAEYMDGSRWPLSSQKGLTPEQQMLIDAMNYDDLAPYEAEGRQMTPKQAAVWVELKAKHAARPEVTAELKRQKQAQQPRPA